MDYRTEYNKWLKYPGLDSALRAELAEIQGNEAEIEERFYTSLDFGTAGLRGILGAGTNRMNIHIIEHATQGLADYLNTLPDAAEKGVAIAYDSRHFSEQFSLRAAQVLSANGIRVYLYKTLHSVPQLSFTIRHLKCKAGIAVTASHNPPQYNGYKVFWEDGGQIGPEQAEIIMDCIQNAPDFIADVVPKPELISMIGEEIDQAYYAAIKSLLLNPSLIREHGNDIKIAYTPLHGSGNVPIRQLFESLGFSGLQVVSAQANPDGDFPTVKTPNPEDPAALELVLKLAKEINADLALATDPDSDRLGVAVADRSGDYKILTGNQIGSLLAYYIIKGRSENNTLPHDALCIRSVVTSRLIDSICRKYGVKTDEVLTGFRHIAARILASEVNPNENFIFGFEESYGFLPGSFVRDKDAICSAMMIAEAALYYSRKGMTLYDVLNQIYEEFGYFDERVKSYMLTGKAGAERISSAMRALRENLPLSFANIGVSSVQDYLKGLRTFIGSGKTEKLYLPESDVLIFTLKNCAWVAIRPSGTEPKLKLYIGADDKNPDALDKMLNSLMADADSLLKSLLGLLHPFL